MDTTIRKLDPGLYRALKARAALAGRRIGDMLNEAIRSYLGRPEGSLKRGTLRDLVPEVYPRGNEKLSKQIDRVVYGL